MQRKKRVGEREGAIWQKVKGIVERERTANARKKELRSQPWLPPTTAA